MKSIYDRNAKSREFLEGSMVLLRMPGLCGKLNDSWDGPYEIHRRVSDVNYEVVLPNRKGKKKIVHVNNCKKWHHADASVLRIVVAAEDIGEDEKDKLLLFGDQMTDSKRQTLKGILDSYADVLKDDPGLLKGVSHVN